MNAIYYHMIGWLLAGVVIIFYLIKNYQSARNAIKIVRNYETRLKNVRLANGSAAEVKKKIIITRDGLVLTEIYLDDSMQVHHVNIAPGASSPEHQHGHQIFIMLKGQLDLTHYREMGGARSSVRLTSDWQNLAACTIAWVENQEWHTVSSDTGAEFISISRPPLAQE